MSSVVTPASWIERLVLRRLAGPRMLRRQLLRRLRGRGFRLIDRLHQRSSLFASAQGEAFVWPHGAGVAALPSAQGIYLTVDATLQPPSLAERAAAGSLSAQALNAAPAMPSDGGRTSLALTSSTAEHTAANPSLQQRLLSSGERASAGLRSAERLAAPAQSGEPGARRTDVMRGLSDALELVSHSRAPLGGVLQSGGDSAAIAAADAPAVDVPIGEQVVHSVARSRAVTHSGDVPNAFELRSTEAPPGLDRPFAAQSGAAWLPTPLVLEMTGIAGRETRSADGARAPHREATLTAAALTQATRNDRARPASVPEHAPTFAVPPGELPLRRTTVGPTRTGQPAPWVSHRPDSPVRPVERMPVSERSEPSVRKVSPPQPEVDLDRLTRQVTERLSAELLIERLRRGIRPWG